MSSSVLPAKAVISVRHGSVSWWLALVYTLIVLILYGYEMISVKCSVIFSFLNLENLSSILLDHLYMFLFDAEMSYNSHKTMISKCPIMVIRL